MWIVDCGGEGDEKAGEINVERKSLAAGGLWVVECGLWARRVLKKRIALEGGGLLDWQAAMALQFKIVVEKHADGFVAYPLGLKGVVAGEGDSYQEALADVTSAIGFHIETFGKEALPDDNPVLEAFIAETTVAA